LQSPSVWDPSVEEKIEILHLIDRLGIETADIGLPGAGPHQVEAVERLCCEIRDAGLKVKANCAARTLIVDVEPIVAISHRTGVPIEVCAFIGSSPIRQYAEEWDMESMLRNSRESIEFAVGEGLEVMYVTEDTVRARPDDLRVLLTAGIEAGARRLCLCDTVGAAIPQAVRNLVSWVVRLVDELGMTDEVGIDWHGHRDRGLDLANTLAALEAGATRVHGTALGVGERVGNTAMEQLLVNLKLLGWRHDDLSCLPEYIEKTSTYLDVPVAVNMPIVGRDAFRTGTGVHAAAVIKARRKGDKWLADRVYSGVPAEMIGREQVIEISPMSGASNVLHYLETHDLPGGAEVVEAVLAAAKRSKRALTKEEVLEVVSSITA
jgi:2-isopropylmalate synthase